MRIGFVGLGTMGGRMVARLVRANLAPVVFDRVPAAVDRCVAAGAEAGASVEDVVARVDVLLTSLPMPSDVEEVYRQAVGTARAGQVFADLSTIDPATARRVAAALAAKDVQFLDAPVSGGPSGAEAGTLSVMVGGEACALERARPVLEPFAARVFHVGPVGAGSTVKLANQLLVGAGTIAAMEVAAFATRAGIALETVLDVLSASAGDSVMLRRSIRDFAIGRDFSPAFPTKLLVKDLRLYAGEVEALGTTSPAGAPTLALFERAMAAGLAHEDYAAVLKVIERGAQDAG